MADFNKSGILPVMKLEKIKLSGFKSFVDSTTIPIKGNLISIVGPNGCGKSNIIDAVRWVMGESSAKHLRGGSMSDVIFNGSSSRQAVNTASVELVFDNSDADSGGELAQYSTIAIKRQVSRDGKSQYQFNGSKCRRKDITDLFLGTGLGARSYAIIEQGTISRLVEAKPDELRVHIEEAAGVTKYKERRHETHQRIKQTRENLERLTDVRDEVEKQCVHLKKQANKAEKYTELKAEERQLKLELFAMRWQNYEQSHQQLEHRLQTVSATHNELFMQRKSVQAAESSASERYKQQALDIAEQQERFYQFSVEITGLEQFIEHNEQSHKEAREEQKGLQTQLVQWQDALKEDTSELEEQRLALVETEESIDSAEEHQEEALEAQSAVQTRRFAWQKEWEVHKNQQATYREQAEVKRMLMAQLENQAFQLQGRLQRLDSEKELLNEQGASEDIGLLDQEISMIESERKQLQVTLDAVQLSIKEGRQIIKQQHDALHTHRTDLQHIKGKLASLELLQQHAMGKDKQKLSHWLDSMALSENSRLAEYIEVSAGWDSAVETVLGNYLEAVCIDSAEQLIDELSLVSDQSLTLFEMQPEAHTKALNKGFVTLLDKVTTPWNLQGLLSSIYCAENLDDARLMLPELKAYESVITPEGVWVGLGWLKLSGETDAKTGVLQREQELKILKEQQIELQASVVLAEEQLESAESFLKTSETKRESLQQEDKLYNQNLSSKMAEFSAHSARTEQQQQRLLQVNLELNEVYTENQNNLDALEEAKEVKEQAEMSLETLEELQYQLEQSGELLQCEVGQSDTRLNECRQQVHSFQAKISSLKSTIELSTKQILRMTEQKNQAQERLRGLEHKLDTRFEPMDDKRKALKTAIDGKAKVECDLERKRKEHQQLDSTIAVLIKQLDGILPEIEQKKEQLEAIRFEQQENRVRQQTVLEQLEELQADITQLVKQLSETANADHWEVKIQDLSGKISRIGMVNLSAMDEYKEKQARVDFLNSQHEDLTAALTMLEEAIIKIDKESRQRFKQTFDKINIGLQTKFPKLFGGGKAYLALTDDNLLESGVHIIAQPPGKRNSSIHLLSGGEKALTAVALVFSIFELNPAPFCLLDEVDAPLDEANVRRFSEMVREMSESVQFLYISHNKVTMEIAHQLAGVTMKEPGVSRMVAVDIQEAVNMAEA